MVQHSFLQLYAESRTNRPMWRPRHEGLLEVVQLVDTKDTPALIKQQLNEQTIKT